MPGIVMLALARTRADVDQRADDERNSIVNVLRPLSQRAGRRQQHDVEIARSHRLDHATAETSRPGVGRCGTRESPAMSSRPATAISDAPPRSGPASAARTVARDGKRLVLQSQRRSRIQKKITGVTIST